MAFTRAQFSLFFSLPLDGLDWGNLLNSHVKRVQAMLPFCTPDFCKRLAGHGISLQVRVPRDRLMDIASVAVEMHSIKKWVQVDGAIIDNEPEHTYDMRYGSPTWGHQHAYQHRRDMEAALYVLRPLGIRVCSPGWTSRVKDFNWKEGLFPGEQSWLEVTRIEYNRCDYNGLHAYTYDGTAYDINERMRRIFHREQERRHRPLWVNEIGVDRGTQVERMAVYIEIARQLMTTNTASVWYGAGERVEGFTPFVSNGTPNGHWDAGYLLRDPACYALLGEFMMEG
jgi:hypothetical protein